MIKNISPGQKFKKFNKRFLISCYTSNLNILKIKKTNFFLFCQSILLSIFYDIITIKEIYFIVLLYNRLNYFFLKHYIQHFHCMYKTSKVSSR